MALSTLLSEDSPGSFVTVEADASGKITVPQADQLFGADFQRSGPDLMLVNDGMPTLVVPNYFAGPAEDIFAPNGAVLRGPVVESLAGPLAAGLYAQQGVVQGLDPIGQVESLSGTASLRRADGTQEEIGPETKIFVGDLVQTGPSSSVSLTFVDGTIFTLSSDTRMIIDELVYDPGRSDNGAVFNLIQGTFVFIAGQIAPTGGMEITTPTATMGIRGTTVMVDIQTINGVVTVEVTLLRDPDGSVGRVELFDLSGNPIADITTTDTKWIIAGDDSQPQEVVRTAEDLAEDAILIAEAVSAYESATSRVEEGGTYVTLDARGDVRPPDAPLDTPPTALEPDGEEVAPTAPDAAPQLAPPPAPPSTAPPSQTQPSIQEEGSLDPADPAVPPLAPSLRVAGLEDGDGSGTISGTLAAGTALPVSFALVDLPANGTITLGPDGAFVYTPDADFNGEDAFSYLVTDSLGRTAVGQVTVEVASVNDAPDAADATVLVTEDGAISGFVSAVDVDGDLLTFTLAAGPVNGEVVLTDTGAFTYSPAPDFAGTDVFLVAVEDGAGGITTASVAVTVANVNDAPVVISTALDATGLAQEDSIVSATGQLAAADPDPGEVLVWSGSADGALGRFEIDPDTGIWTYTLDNAAAQPLGAGETRVETFAVTVTDSAGETAEQTVTVTVTGTNDVPEISDVVIQNGAGAVTTGQLVATDVDAGTGVTFALGDTTPANGQVEILSDGRFTYTPDPGFRGEDSFSYVVEDGTGAVSTAVVTVLVEGDHGTTPGDQDLTVDIDPGAGDPALPGVVEITRTPVLGNAVNIGIILDWTAGVDATQISDMVAAVSEALDDIAARFEGSETQVEVQLLAFGETAFLNQSFDLQDPALRAALESYDFGQPALELSFALSNVKPFYVDQPTGEANYLYIFTPGDVPDPFLAIGVEALTTPAFTGFEVTLEAFTYGGIADPAVVSLLDADPIELTDAASLSDAVEAQPIFGAVLVDLSIGLFADGIDQGEIADESNAALVETADGVSLALADISGIEALLGSENILTVRAGFDLDGDTSTTELTLFSSETLAGPAAAASGASTARSVAEFDLAGDLTGALLSLAQSASVEAIDMENAEANALTLTGADVLGLSDRPDALLEALLANPTEFGVTVYGDAEDDLILLSTADGSFAPAAQAPVVDGEGNTLALYTFSDASGPVATVAVDADVAVTLAAAQAV
jgi:VCBS repeat-containing protein